MRSRTDGPVVQIGPLPPPYGGVSVHVRRLAMILAASGLHVVAFCPEGSEPVPNVEVVRLAEFTWRGLLQSDRPRLKARVVHCHEGWEWSPALLLAAMRGSRVVVTVHNETTMYGLAAFSWHYRLASRLLLASPSVRWIAVSARIGEGLVRQGARVSNVAVAPAYLPMVVEGAGSPALPAELGAFASTHYPLLTVYGWRLSVTANGADLYGFDLAIEAVDQLRAVWSGCGLIILVPGGEPSERVSALRRTIEDRGLRDNVCLWTDALADPTSLWTATDVYLRPTRSDGDAVSVREVLLTGGKVVASDCCDRPDGVRLFASGDSNALKDSVLEALSGPAGAPRPDPSAGDMLRAVTEAYGLSGGSLPGVS